MRAFLIQHGEALLITICGLWATFYAWGRRERLRASPNFPVRALPVLAPIIILLGLVQFVVDAHPSYQWQRAFTEDHRASAEFPGAPTAGTAIDSAQVTPSGTVTNVVPGVPVKRLNPALGGPLRGMNPGPGGSRRRMNSAPEAPGRRMNPGSEVSVKRVTLGFNVPQRDINLQLSYSEIPPSGADLTVEQRLEALKTAFAQMGTLLSCEPDGPGDIPIYRVVLDMNEGKTRCVVRLAIAPNALYRAVATASSDSRDDPLVRRFLNSFRME
ncbi:MAG: hypothetical protein ABSG04_08990 [Verrucomicrobiota bacterium]|jgi:hypothetical protein